MTERFEGREDEYDGWFGTPAGSLVLRYEKEIIDELVRPGSGDLVLDAGCGTGIFTTDILRRGARVAGLDVAASMLERAREKLSGFPFFTVRGDMRRLPFPDGTFDAAISVTALEFIEDAQRAIDELFRVARPGGTIVVATLNRLGPWAARRQARTGEHVLRDAYYRSPDDLRAMAPVAGTVKTAVHFEKDDSPDAAAAKERAGRGAGAETGAFIAVRWVKPGRDRDRNSSGY